MKKLVFVLFALISFGASAQQTSWFIEHTGYSHDDYTGLEKRYSFTYSSFSHQFKCGLGIWNYSLFGNERRGSIGGLNYAFKTSNASRLEIGSGAGWMKDCKGVRASSYFLFQNGKTGYIDNRYQSEIYGSIEYLGMKRWYVFYAKYNIFTHMCLGVQTQSDAVVGPRIEFMRDAIHLWTVPGYNPDTDNIGVQFGVSYRFF